MAAVAATSRHMADEALKLIKVEYEPLPAVTWVLDAMETTRRCCTTTSTPTRWARSRTSPATLPRTSTSKQATSTTRLPRPMSVVEREFKTASVHQGYIEPHVRHGAVESGRPPDHLDLDARFVHRPAADGRVAADSGFASHGRAVRNRRRLWRQDRRLSGARGRHAEPQVRHAGEDGNEPRRSVRGHRADARLVHAGEARRHERRQARGRRSLAGVRRRRVSRRHDRPGLHVCVQLLRDSQRPGRWLRRGGQQAQDAGLSGTRRHAGGVCLRIGGRRVGRKAGRSIRSNFA